MYRGDLHGGGVGVMGWSRNKYVFSKYKFFSLNPLCQYAAIKRERRSWCVHCCATMLRTAGVLSGNPISCNTTRNSERKIALSKASEKTLKTSKNLCKPLKTSQNLYKPLKTSENPLSERPCGLWETLSEADFSLRASQACCSYSCCPLIFLQQKSLTSVIFPPVILGPEMAAPMLWAPDSFWCFLLENPHDHKIPRFRGGVYQLYAIMGSPSAHTCMACVCRCL